MKKTKKTIFLIVTLLCTQLYSQKNINLSSLFIPQELKEDANAVVRLNHITVNIEAVNKQTIHKKRIVTVLNKLGNTHVDAYAHYNDDTRVTKLTAVIYDALGNKIKKYAKNDFLDVSAVDDVSLYSDSRVKYLEHTPTSYPYTVVFESEETNSSTGFIPRWFPVENYNLAIEKSIYTFNNPQNIPYRKREQKFKGYNIQQSTVENGITYTLSNQKAIDYERHSVNIDEFLPNLKIALNEFSLKNIQGKGENWKEFGKWMYDDLLKDKTELTPSTIAKVKDLTKNVEDPIEKAKIIYNYVQNKTRYISVQIDIGGWEPIAANKVDDVSYGDCKGLTNYTKALLDAVNVESYYTVVYAKNRRNIDKDFTSIEGNHVILNIPNEEEDIWLECTSQTMPFNFLGDFTDDRDVLVITPEGGLIKRTPAYINDDNLQLINATIELLPNGSISSSLERKSYATQYDDKFYIEGYTEKELSKYYKTQVWDYNNNLETNNIQLNNDKDKVEFTEKLDIKIQDFASIRDNNYLFKLNIFNRITGIPKRYRTRLRPLEIDRGFTDKDEFTFKIPSGYTITTLPENKKITNKFGVYSISFKKIDETSFTYKREFSLKKGVFPKEDYKLYRNFIKEVVKLDNLRTELIKK
ncbi:DUF3857 domain-containing protein [Tenacibaculum crassostreae]|uniref:DUF3857 domain-containing protein n=1 Tax=Tenacibaculum crassostreae TaxID=502683 RepID=UPI003893C8B8